MNLLLGPALRLILSPANLRSLNITVLDQRSSADLNSLIESDFFVFDETAFSEVLFTFFFLLGLVVCDIGGVASLVIGTRSGSGNSSKAHISVFTTLTLGTTSKS